MNKELRKQRKNEHIEHFLSSEYRGDTLLDCVYIEHNSLPNLDLEDISLETKFLSKNLSYPLIINAITGGTSFARKINLELAYLAKEFNIAMAVGSQTIGLDDKTTRDSFRVVREVNPPLVIGNLSGNSDSKKVGEALDFLEADGIQLHLNPAQELVMPEGDRKFYGILENISKIRKDIDKPIIVKEVGFGMNKKTISKLLGVGINNIDISGQGGTNFIEIEDKRNKDIDFSDLYDWGVPTALSLIEARKLNRNFTLIASGGIEDSMDVFKGLVLGADMIGISGKLLRILIDSGYDEARKYLENLFYKLKILMLLTESEKLEDLKDLEYRTSGKLKDLLNSKEI